MKTQTFLQLFLCLVLIPLSRVQAQIVVAPDHEIELFAGNVGPAQGLTSLAFDSEGNLFIAPGDNFRPLKIAAGTNVPEVFGNVFIPDADGVTVDSEDNLIVSGKQVVKFAPNEDFLWSHEANIGNVQLVTVDDQDNIYVGSLGDTLAVISSDGVRINNLEITGGPSDPVFGPEGDLYIALPLERQLIKIDNVSGVILDTVLSDVFAVSPVFDTAGDIYFADERDGVYKLNLDSMQIDTIVTGLVTPRGLAFDLNGDLFVSSRSERDIYKITLNAACKDSVCGQMNEQLFICQQGETFCIDQIDLALYLANEAYCGPCEISNTRSIADANDRIKLYPNPFSNSFSVNVESELLNNSAELTIYDLLGKVVEAKDVSTSELTEIDLSSATSGVYFYSLEFDDGTRYTGKVTKQ